MKIDAASKTISRSLLQTLAETLSGTQVIQLLGPGLVEGSLSVALPAAWIYQLGRSIEARSNEACLVLQCTIDRTIFGFTGDYSTLSCDNYLVEEMRTHLALMTKISAESYLHNKSMQPRYRGAIDSWISGFPYYDPSILSSLLKSCLDASVIGSIDDTRTSYPRSNHEYQTVVDLVISDEPTLVKGEVSSHEFNLKFDSWNRPSLVETGWVFTLEYDGRSYDLYDAPHGWGRNEISSYTWRKGDEEDFSSNHFTGEEFPFFCTVRLDEITRKRRNGDYVEVKVLVRIKPK
jgi:hypothetical protein